MPVNERFRRCADGGLQNLPGRAMVRYRESERCAYLIGAVLTLILPSIYESGIRKQLIGQSSGQKCRGVMGTAAHRSRCRRCRICENRKNSLRLAEF